MMSGNLWEPIVQGPSISSRLIDIHTSHTTSRDCKLLIGWYIGSYRSMQSCFLAALWGTIKHMLIQQMQKVGDLYDRGIRLVTITDDLHIENCRIRVEVIISVEWFLRVIFHQKQLERRECLGHCIARRLNIGDDGLSITCKRLCTCLNQLG